MNIVVLSEVSSYVALLQGADQVHEEVCEGSKDGVCTSKFSFTDIGRKLERIRQLEEQVRTGNATKEMMEKLAMLGALDVK